MGPIVLLLVFLFFGPIIYAAYALLSFAGLIVEDFRKWMQRQWRS